jgi:hypothetical protein
LKTEININDRTHEKEKREIERRRKERKKSIGARVRDVELTMR